MHVKSQRGGTVVLLDSINILHRGGQREREWQRESGYVIIYRGGWISIYYLIGETLEAVHLFYLLYIMEDIRQFEMQRGGCNLPPPLYTFRGSRSCKEYYVDNGMI